MALLCAITFPSCAIADPQSNHGRLHSFEEGLEVPTYSSPSYTPAIQTPNAVHSANNIAPVKPYPFEPGDSLAPYLHYTAAYQHIASNLSARMHRLEIGYEMFSILIERNDYQEQNPQFHLRDTRQMIFIRFPVQLNEDESVPAVSVAYGIGSYTLSGEQKTHLIVQSLPIKYKPLDFLSFELRPSWFQRDSNTKNIMEEYQLSMHLGSQYAGVEIGYRTLTNQGATIDGPFAAISLYY